MVIKKSNLNKLLILLALLIGTNLFGIYDFRSDGLFIGINIFDVVLIMLNTWFAYLYFSNKTFRCKIHNSHLKYLLYVYIFIFVVFFTMPLRGPISVIDAIRVGRDFLLIPIAFLIFGQPSYERDCSFYIKVMTVIGVISSVQIFANALNPELVSSLFPYVGVKDGQKFGFDRNAIISKTMLFPHFLTLFYLGLLLFREAKKKYLLLFFFFFTASALQGFRSYFLVLSFIIAFVLLKRFRFRKTFRIISVFIFLFGGILLLDITKLDHQITGKFATTIVELSGEKEGTAMVRYNRDLVTRFPMFYEKPLLGWGFIYYGSEYGRELGLGSAKLVEDQFSIYSIDSGYLTLLIQLGLVGLLIVIVLYYLMSKSIYQNTFIKDEIKLATIGGTIILIIALYTHGGFFRDFGLLPLMIFIGLTNFAKSIEY